MPTWALRISPLHQPAAWLLIRANLSSGRLERKCCSVILVGKKKKKEHTASPLTARTASSWIINFCGQGRAKARPGQPWINDISGWLREALPSPRNQSPSPRQRHINLSGESFAFPSYPVFVLPPPPPRSARLPGCIEAVRLKALCYKLTSVRGFRHNRARP